MTKFYLLQNLPSLSQSLLYHLQYCFDSCPILEFTRVVADRLEPTGLTNCWGLSTEAETALGQLMIQTQRQG